MASRRQQEAAAAVRADQQVWRAIVAEVGPERLEVPRSLGDWSFRDVAAHLAAWRNLRIPMIEAVARGEAVPATPWPPAMEGDYDAINDWMMDRDREVRVDQVLADYDSSFERLATAIEAMPEALAEDPDALPWAEGTALVDIDFTDHLHDEHLPAIRAWLAGR